MDDWGYPHAGNHPISPIFWGPKVWVPSLCWEQETFGSLTLATEPRGTGKAAQHSKEILSELAIEKTKHDMDLHSFVWFSNVWYDVWYLRYYQFDHNMISGKPKGCHHAARAMHGSSPHISTVAAASGSRAWPSDKTVVVASGKMLKLMGVFRSRTCDIGTI